MDIKRLAKRWMPPILVDWYRTFKYGRPYQGYIWEGIYRNYRDVPVVGAGYAEDRLTQETLAYTINVLAASRRYRFIPTEVMGEHAFLPLLVSILGRDRNTVSILDFGGGMGVDYIHLVNSVVHAKDVDYHIVENRSVCEAGSRLFENDSRIHFYPALPTGLAKVDIIYMCSALQYIENYADLLKALSDYHPEYFLFVKLSAGDIPTYATDQTNLPVTRIAYWFINVREIESLMSKNGYSLIFKSALEREYDQNNFPAEYRLKRACNLLFRRAGNE